MKPVYQTRFPSEDGAEAHGDCWGAALASLLEIPLGAVPEEIAESEDWAERTLAFLEQFGLSLMWRFVRREGETSGFAGYYLESGKARGGPWHHIVVCKDGEMVHDPSPGGRGLAPDDGTRLGRRVVYQLVVQDPAKLHRLVELQESREDTGTSLTLEIGRAAADGEP